VIRIGAADLVDVRGTAVVRGITLRAGAEIATHGAAVVALALPGAPSFELPAQAGAAVRFDPAVGYVVVADAQGRVAEGAWAVGECTGAPFDPDALRAAGERVAAAVHAALG
jgi:sarcosine oxidase subunit alpha